MLSNGISVEENDVLTCIKHIYLGLFLGNKRAESAKTPFWQVEQRCLRQSWTVAFRILYHKKDSTRLNVRRTMSKACLNYL